ncbi:MAG: hypothetical protein N3G20_00975 [Verrucomicrobiae bacterium]|nr:hypothetical protein [Verrucomicrobiae bacterium]
MQQKSATVVLALICVALLAGLVFRHKTAIRERLEHMAALAYVSNQWNETKAKLDKVTEENNNLVAKLNAKTAELQSTALRLAQTEAALESTNIVLRTVQQQLEQARQEISQRDSRISQLETQYAELDKQANAMKASIEQLQSKIAETEEKLARSEGDREFLLKELKRLQAEKADLERKFNDLVALREQYKKLKEELAVFRRIEWIRQGLYGHAKKGAELLQSGIARVAPAPVRTNIGLDVEIRRDGSATIIPPGTSSTGQGVPAGTHPQGTVPVVGPPGTAPTSPGSSNQPK